MMKVVEVFVVEYAIISGTGEVDLLFQDVAHLHCNFFTKGLSGNS